MNDTDLMIKYNLKSYMLYDCITLLKWQIIEMENRLAASRGSLGIEMEGVAMANMNSTRDGWDGAVLYLHYGSCDGNLCVLKSYRTKYTQHGKLVKYD